MIPKKWMFILILLMSITAVQYGCETDRDARSSYHSTSSGVPGTASTTVHESTVVDDDDDDVGDVGDDEANILSRAVNIVGAIIALPFRLVAGLFDLVF